MKEFDSRINKKVNSKISINISELLTEDRSQTPGKGNLRGNSHHSRVANMLPLTKKHKAHRSHHVKMALNPLKGEFGGSQTRLLWLIIY